MQALQRIDFMFQLQLQKTALVCTPLPLFSPPPPPPAPPIFFSFEVQIQAYNLLCKDAIWLLVMPVRRPFGSSPYYLPPPPPPPKKNKKENNNKSTIKEQKHFAKRIFGLFSTNTINLQNFANICCTHEPKHTHTHKTYLIVLGRDVSHSTSPTVSSLCFTTASTIFLSTHAHMATSPGSNLSLSNSALAVCGSVSLACKYKTMWCRTGGPKDSRGGYTDYKENKDLVENGQKTNEPSKCSAISSNCIFPWWMVNESWLRVRIGPSHNFLSYKIFIFNALWFDCSYNSSQLRSNNKCHWNEANQWAPKIIICTIRNGSKCCSVTSPFRHHRKQRMSLYLDKSKCGK